MPPEPGASIPNEVVKQIVDCIATGRTIEAIRLYREATGAGLQEAHEAIEALAQGQATGAQPAPTALQPEAMDEVASMLRAGNKIAAIRAYRATTGRGLKDSKEAVEAIEDELRRRDPASFPARKSGCTVTFAMLACVVVAGGWLVLR